MENGTSRNNRYSPDQWTEGLLTGAGASLGRVLDERQRHAVNLSLEVFAYLLAAVPAETMRLADVIRLIKWYAGGVNNAKSES